MWKPTLLKGWVSNLFCFLAFLKSLFADQQPVLFMARCPSVLFLWVYWYNKPQVFDQSDHGYYLSYFINIYIPVYIYLSGFAKTWLQKSLLYTLSLSLVMEHVFLFVCLFFPQFLFIYSIGTGWATVTGFNNVSFKCLVEGRPDSCSSNDEFQWRFLDLSLIHI